MRSLPGRAAGLSAVRLMDFGLLLGIGAAPAMAAAVNDIDQRVEHRHAESNGVKIHYAVLGEGPLVLMIHGFPDFWYSWRHQMDALSKTHRVAAMDLRGYNLSDKPVGIENYDMRLLVADAAAVIRHAGAARAIVVGHDWGGAIAWQLAMHVPAMVDRLIIVNLPHPHGLARELASNPEQQKSSAYARNFQKPDAHESLSAEKLAELVPADARDRYIEAYRRSSFEAMLAYYKRNYPREPYAAPADEPVHVKAPVLQFHGMRDRALLPGALDGAWRWIDNAYTLVTIPNAGHWAHWDQADLVTRAMVRWVNEK